MLNVNSLKAEIKRNGLTQTEFCNKIGMAHSTFIRKMKKKNVTTDEAERMVKVLNLKNANEIFFGNN